MTDLVAIVAIRHFCFFNRTPAGEIDRRIVTAGTAEALPRSAADKALEKGVAALQGTKLAKEAATFNGSTDHITMAHCVNLGDPLGVLATE
ncbi:hypothetical protein [Rhizobium alvei]|uniref:Uncharacterized protein n=1 Tax=Rhizobium alvei TaxID=1132659 RepID=A0ABT8YJZ0_9HYPH|nr:hypothetical protein [Rhizobium alvei]MDO6963990.1 hypothetical protein [Rhizobium alvei]